MARYLACVVAVGLALGLGPFVKPAGAGLLAPHLQCPSASRGDLSPFAQRRAMRCLVNYARASRGLGTLRVDDRLADAGALKIGVMLRCRQFAHTPCGQPFRSIFNQSGYSAATVGENLAWGAGEVTPRRIFVLWLRSTAHRENLLDPRWRATGLSVRVVPRFLGESNVTIWAHEFGTS